MADEHDQSRLHPVTKVHMLYILNLSGLSLILFKSAETKFCLYNQHVTSVSFQVKVVLHVSVVLLQAVEQTVCDVTV